MIRSLGIFTAPKKAGVRDLTHQLIALGEARGMTLRLQRAFATDIERADLSCDSDDEIAAADVIVTLSGDGGVLQAARAAAPHRTPILSIDLGRLGFLSAVGPQGIAGAFEQLVNGECLIEERMMLDARVLRRDSANGTSANGTSANGTSATQSTLHDAPALSEVGGSIGLNDAVVAKSALARILRLSISVDGELVAQTRADGLIISTPTGSTAYALSAGGPIVHPGVELLLVCPICAHSLTQRPLVVGAAETIEVQAEWEGDEVTPASLEAMLTIDGQVGVVLQSGDVVRVQRSSSTARLLRVPNEGFYARLREKMRWG